MQPQPSNQGSEWVMLQAAANAEWWDEIHSLVPSAEMMYDGRHRALYRALESLHGEGKGIDATMIATELARHNGATVGAAMLDELLNSFGADVLNYRDHAQEVRSQWVRRRLVETGLMLQSRARDQQVEVKAILDEAQADVMHLSDDGALTTMRMPERLAADALAGYEERAKLALESGSKVITGIPTGIDALDRHTHGFRAPRYIVVAARPSIGKSSLLKTTHKNLAERKIPSALFTWEEPADVMYASIAAMIARVDSEAAIAGTLDPTDRDKLEAAIKKLAKLPLVIVDAHRMDVYDMRSCVRILKRDMKLAVVSADYVQKITHRERDDYTGIKKSSSVLYTTSQEEKLVLIAAAQLNRDSDKRVSREPMMHDLRDCGNIEQDADTIFLIHRPEFWGESHWDGDFSKGSCVGRAKLLLAKHRGGRPAPKGIEVAFKDTWAEFGDIDFDINPQERLDGSF